MSLEGTIVSEQEKERQAAPTAVGQPPTQLLPNGNAQPPQQVTQQQPTPQAVEQPATQQEPTSESGAEVPVQLELGQLDEQLLAAYGMTAADVFGFVEQQRTAQAQQQLQAEWGVDSAEVSRRVKMVHDYVQRLPPAQQALYQTVDGIQVLYHKLAKESGQAPTFDRSSPGTMATPSGTNVMYTRSQLRSMTEADRRANHAQRLYAYNNNLVGDS